MSRPNRGESQHKQRRTLEDEFSDGNLNLIGTPDPDRYYHVVNEDKGGVQKKERRGYRIEDGSNGVSLGDANPKEVGSVVTATSNPSYGGKAVLMSIERKFKQEDDKFRQDQVDATEKAVYQDQENEQDYGRIKKS